MQLLPPKQGRCPVCAVEHESENPHNTQSLHYQYWFHGHYHRWPTWADAIAHCDSEMQKAWKNALQAQNNYSEPDDGIQPIANHPNDYKSQMTDISSTVTVKHMKIDD